MFFPLVGIRGFGFWGLEWYKDQTIGKKGGGDVKSGWVGGDIW